MVTRRFISVGGRQVHCRIMGSGPPAVFVHSSPANSSFVIPDMTVVAGSYTCVAFDTPGFGLSDPLPADNLTVADLADALAATFDELRMPACPVFGTHTGAAIALELAVRHPERVTGIVLDGLASFTPVERDALIEGYFTDFPIDPLGGHYSALWTRFRDQSTWFPWFARSPKALNESDLTSPQSTSRWMTMYFDAADTYAAPYRAAISYANGPAQFTNLKVPAIVTAIESDMLYPHMARIPITDPRHEIRRVGNSATARRALTQEAFDRFGSTGVAPVFATRPAASSQIVRQFIDVSHGQLLARMIGDPFAPALLLVHDLPGSSEAIEDQMAALAVGRFVVAFDLPGCSNSDPLPTPTVANYAAALAAGCVELGIAPVVVWGIGWGSTIAIEVAVLIDARCTVVEGLALPDAAERIELVANIAPPITIEPDGAHWFRTWQMLRDGEIWWPWFTPVRASLRRVPGHLDARSLHRRTCETLRQADGHVDALAAILAHDPTSTLSRPGARTACVADADAPVATAFATRLGVLIGAAAMMPRAAIEAEL